MKTEISAGGIVFKIKKGKPNVLLIKDHNSAWTFPKGLIENDENRVKTAQREVVEEVGLKKIKFVSELSAIGYWYKWKGDLIKKTVYYYLFVASGDEKLKPQKEEGISEAKWFTIKKALKVVGYRKTGLALLKEAIEKIKISSQLSF